MNKSLRLSLFVSLIVTLSAFTLPDPGHAQAKKRAFTKGESLKFTVSYGFLNAAEAVMEVAPEVKRFNERPVYKIDVTGQTLGIFKLFKVNDTWGTYLDTARLIPYHSYRFLEEGKYRKNERVYFDQQKGKAEMKLFDREDTKVVDTKTFDIPQQVQDIVSGFYYLRSMDLGRHKPGDVITINAFSINKPTPSS
nr:DUF3108 domain-containing protein [Nitritalea halalkaliphila]